MPENNRELKKSSIEDRIKFASDEEKEFFKFLCDAREFGLIFPVFTYQPGPWELVPRHAVKVEKQLKTKVKEVERVIFRNHSYTPDFEFRMTDLFRSMDHRLMLNPKGGVIVDVKGAYNRHGGDRAFTIHQKLMKHKYDLYVNKVVPSELFQRLKLAPDEFRWMKNRRKPTLKKAYKGTVSFQEMFRPRA